MILYVDYTDVCRAPLAAAIYERVYRKKAYSAGVYADDGAALCDAVRPALLNGHKARRLSASMLDKADEVWCVTASIAWHLAEDYPKHAAKIHAMTDIPDPIGMGEQAYAQCAREIRRQLEGSV